MNHCSFYLKLISFSSTFSSVLLPFNLIIGAHLYLTLWAPQYCSLGAWAFFQELGSTRSTHWPGCTFPCGAAAPGLALSLLGPWPHAFAPRPLPGGCPSSSRNLLSSVLVSSCGSPKTSFSERKLDLPATVPLKNSYPGFRTALTSVIAHA